MEILEEWPIKLQKVRTKSGAILHRIVGRPDHFFLEQNPKKNSRFGVAYRKIKAVFPEFYMFWEFKNGDYTGRLLTGAFLEKQEIEDFIDRVLKGEVEYKTYPDVKDEPWS
jgi:hypothetical protein